MSDFPMDVIAEILSRLPVKPLLCFRCVSKPWRVLINSPSFVKLHLKRSVETNTNHSLIIGSGGSLYSVDLDLLDHAVELDHPFKCKKSNIDVLGSCDGLLCLFDTLYTHEDIVLWNPSTRKHRKLPTSPIEISHKPCYCYREFFCRGHIIVYGFGYDVVNDDYKVVRMVQYQGKDDYVFDSEVKVYSVKSNSWRRVKDFPYYIWYLRVNGVFTSGALHWVVNERPESSYIPDLIAAFDLGSEEYGLVPMPEFSDKNFKMNVDDLGGCLCVCCEYFDGHVDVWVMKEYGAKESWTKLFSVAQGSVIKAFRYVKPLAYSKSGGEVILEQDNAKLLWYDLKKEKVEKIKIHGVRSFHKTRICLGGLVPLHDVGGSDEKKQQAQKKMHKKKGRKKR